ncbi:MAG: DUF1569 domain-containing protein [Burkholderiales bacterium]
MSDAPATMDAERRSTLRRIGVVVGVGAFAAPLVVSAVHPAGLASERFGSIAAAVKTLEQLKAQAPQMTGAWDLPHVLHHVAQSIEYSMVGFPELKAPWFRATLGSYAFALFNARGQMTHSLSEPIPGATDIAQGQPLAPAVDHVIAALQTFERHGGALAPHFAYGALDKPAYTRAHLMHLANHWAEVA